MCFQFHATQLNFSHCFSSQAVMGASALFYPLIHFHSSKGTQKADKMV
jgi:hypothetical protein